MCSVLVTRSSTLSARTDDDFLAAEGLNKGGMTLIDEARAEALYKAMGPATIVSGGSAANTVIGAASLGCTAAFIGKLKADDAGAALSTIFVPPRSIFQRPAQKMVLPAGAVSCS